jgi:hypothetical protein
VAATSSKRGWVYPIGAAVLLIAAALVIWRLDLFAVPAGPVATAFESPRAYPGYPWTRNGQPVAPEEMSTIAGPEHCDWQSATMLNIGWPPGTRSTTSAQARQYIRDPNGVVGARFRDLLMRNATLPADARATGYRYGAIEIYVSPSDQDQAIYVVSASDSERWPRSDPMVLCG